MAEKQAKTGEKQENMAETNQRKAKMTENLEKCGVLQIIFYQ